MGLFSKILDKLGLNKDKAADAAQAQALADMAKKETEARAKLAAAAKPATSAPVAKPAAPAGPVGASAKPASVINKDEMEDVVKHAPSAAAPTPISEVDVVKKLEQMTEGSGLDWKVSIVDLLKVLGIDSSREARNELATELGCPPEFMKDSAKMNTWLHKTVLKKIAENGGNIPHNLLD
jgi:3-oxoacyl-ACP reductase-like protein